MCVTVSVPFWVPYADMSAAHICRHAVQTTARAPGAGAGGEEGRYQGMDDGADNGSAARVTHPS